MRHFPFLLIIGTFAVTLADEYSSEEQVPDESFDYDLVGSPYLEDGKICHDKDVVVELTKFDKQMKCNVHMEEKCEEMAETCHTMYKKSCTIKYRPTVTEVNVRVCPNGEVNVIDRNDDKDKDDYDEKMNSVVIDVRPTPRPQNKMFSANCTNGKRIVCVKKYETQCKTEYVKQEMEEDHPNCRMEMVEKCRDDEEGQKKCDLMKAMKCKIEKRMVTKTKPETKCNRVPRQYCRKVECREGRRTQSQCYFRTQMVNEMIPDEQCSFKPHRVCHDVLASSLSDRRPVEGRQPRSLADIKTKCHKVPVQKCQMLRINPHPVMKKIRKKVCTDMHRRPV